MVDYHDHYLKKDVLLSADIFEKFIAPCLKLYGLDPWHYFSSQGLSWDTMLKNTGVKLEKIPDIDKYFFTEKGLAGMSYIAKRYAKANNKYRNDYDAKKPSTFISYLDMNNSYAWAMTEYLPYERFKWLKNVDGFHLMSISQKSPIGLFLKVDLEYPDELHKLHNYYPLAPEKLAIFSNTLSHYCKEIADKYETKVGDVKKVIPSLGNNQDFLVFVINQSSAVFLF